MSVFECTEWRRRRPELGELRAFDDGRPIVVMELIPGEPHRGEAWDELRRCWLELLPHFHVLDAIEEQGSTLLLRYAAIDWNYAPMAGDNAFARKMVSTWGRQLVDVYTLIASQLSGDAARFMRPLMMFDVANQLRVGFLPVTEREAWIPREVTATWPACDEPGLVYATAHALRDWCIAWETYDAEPIRSILMRALGLARPRFRTLASLLDAFDELAFPALDENRLEALRATDQGFGWFQVDDIKRATYYFADAVRRNGELRAAKEGLARCNALRRVGEIGAPAETRVSHFDVAQRYEAAGRIADALYFYELALKTKTRVAETQVGIARCQLALGNAPAVLGAARAVLQLEPDHGSALSIAARSAEMLGRHDEAIQLADRRLAIDASDAGIHYVRGRALLALKRFVEAREAFDRACVLEPKRIEAMLLRREADRAARGVAEAAGVARPMTLDLPEHLSFLRDAVAAGRVDEVIPALESRLDDAAAQLVLAECLAFVQRYDEALPVYQRVVDLDPGRRERVAIGRARALLFLERAAEALAALDDAGDTCDATELRAIIRHRLEPR